MKEWSVVKTYLEEKLQVKDIQAEIYSAFARGNLGKAIHLAQSEDFKMMYEEILKLLKEIKEMDISQLLDVIRKLKDDNTDIKECLDFMQMWYRDILMYKTTKDLNLLIFKDEFSAVKKAVLPLSHLLPCFLKLHNRIQCLWQFQRSHDLRSLSDGLPDQNSRSFPQSESALRLLSTFLLLIFLS